MARKLSLLALLLVPVVLFVGTQLLRNASSQTVASDPQAIPSNTRSEPPAQFAAAVASARRAIRAGMAGQKIPGLSVAVGSGGNLVWAEGFGYADVKDHLPVTPDTRFHMGTASTVLTSAAAGALLEKERLKLDEPIQTYVPQFPKKQWPVTLRQLMAGVAGVATDDAEEVPLRRQRCEQPVEALTHFADAPLLFEPGTRYRRSSYGWILVSAAMQAAAGQPFLTVMQESIFQPLRMELTGAESAKQENPEHIGEPEEDPPPLTFLRHVLWEPLGLMEPVHKLPTDIATIYGMRQYNLSCYAGAAAFFSTPSDLVRFGLALHAGTLLKPATIQLLQTPQRLASGADTGHGLGWDVGPALGRDGELLGKRVMSFRIVRETGVVVAVMSNMVSADTAVLAQDVAKAFSQPK